MKKVLKAIFVRPIQNFNVENRAQKILEKRANKPHVAPKHPTTTKEIEQLNKEHPELLEEQKTKNEELHKMLQGMIVNPDKVGEIQARPLPSSRHKVDENEFGYIEPSSVPEGKCTIKQAMTFITAHSANKTGYTARDIAKDYKLDPKQVEDVLRYFRMYQLKVHNKDEDPTRYHFDTEIPPTKSSEKISNEKTTGLHPGTDNREK